MEEPRAAANSGVVEVLEGAVGEERGLAELGLVLRAPRGARRGPIHEAAPVVRDLDAFGSQPVEPRHRIAFGKVADRFEPRQDALVGIEPRITRFHCSRIHARVGVAEQRGLVAEFPGFERDVRVPSVERSPVSYGAVVHEIHARIERRSTRSARRRLREVPAERNPVRREPIDVRRACNRMSAT